MLHRHTKNNPSNHRGHTLPHDIVLLTENLELLEKQLELTSDPKKRNKIIVWIEYVRGNLYQKNAA